MAEPADAHGSGPCGGNSMGVQIPPSAPNSYLVSSCSYLVNKIPDTTQKQRGFEADPNTFALDVEGDSIGAYYIQRG